MDTAIAVLDDIGRNRVLAHTAKSFDLVHFAIHAFLRHGSAVGKPLHGGPCLFRVNLEVGQIVIHVGHVVLLEQIFLAADRVEIQAALGEDALELV